MIFTKLEDRIPGKVYYMIGNDKGTLYPSISVAVKGLICGDRIQFNSKKYRDERSGWNWRTDLQWEIREATSQEEEWLEQCKKAGRYIEYKPKIVNYEIY